MLDLSRYVRPGDGVWWGQGGAEPEPLVNALLDQADAIGPARAFSGLTAPGHTCMNPGEDPS